MMGPTGMLAQADVLAQSPLFWALALAAVGLWLVFARQRYLRLLGRVIGAAGLVLLAASLSAPAAGSPAAVWFEQLVFWSLAAVTLGAAAEAITARSPVYTAIWFALSLLGTAGLFLFQGAQFLGVATIVVYAGAIVVTFLFVLMLAQPRGSARYDQTSWGPLVTPAALFGATALMAIVIVSLPGLVAGPAPAPPAAGALAPAQHHMAHLGSVLFSQHLVAVEIAGTLLLVALVGAIAIVIHGRQAAANARPTAGAAGRAAAGPADGGNQGGGR